MSGIKYKFNSAVLCILHPGCSIKFSIDRTDLGNKANSKASCAFGVLCLLTGGESEHTQRHKDRDHYWAVCHQGNCSCPCTAKTKPSPSQRVIYLFHPVLKSLLNKCDHLRRRPGGSLNSSAGVILFLLFPPVPHYFLKARVRRWDFDSFKREWLILLILVSLLSIS